MYPPSDDNNKYQFKCYIAYILTVIMISLLLIFTYDLATGNWSNTMLANGRCVHLNQTNYGTMPLMFAITGINKAFQIVAFIMYLFYCYKLRNKVHDKKTISARKRDQKLFKIAIAMGATIGISVLFSAFNKISGATLILVEIIAVILQFVQHCIIVTSFRWIRNTCKTVCKKH